MNTNDFEVYIISEGKSPSTAKTYVQSIIQFLKWFEESYGKTCTALYRINILEYINYLKNIKEQNAKTINKKLSSLKQLNEYLVETGVQKEIVIRNKDFQSVQTDYASPTKITEREVKTFIQNVLESGNERNYAMVCLFAYAGLRVSEVVGIKMKDLHIGASECLIRGKGNKQRTIILNNKVKTALNAYLKVRECHKRSTTSDYLFFSQKRDQLSRITVNDFFKKYSDVITPHSLRHFFCTNALEKGLSIHEVAGMAGHSNVQTTLLYTHPDKKKMREKMDLL